jgi:hypothetical protein
MGSITGTAAAAEDKDQGLLFKTTQRVALPFVTILEIVAV